MDTSVQEKTFAGFAKWSARVAMFCIGVLLFLAIVNG